MKKKLSIAIFSILWLTILSCSAKKETPASIAQKWCALNAKVYKAAEGPVKEAAEKARKNFENKMEKKYKGNESFMDEIGKEVEKCEDASEGR